MLLKVKDFKKYFPINKGFLKRDYVRAVDGVDLEICAGESLGIVGESGSGKTTLGRLILKLIPLDSGQIVFDGTDISDFSARRMRQLRHGMQMVFQDPYSSLDPRFTVSNIIKEGMILDKKTSAERKDERVRELLKSVQLPTDVVNRFPHEFSGGERQRIAIARALASNPKLLILDEAVSSLDVLVQDQILDLLTQLQKEFGLTYIFISHNLRVVRKICTRIAVMYKGKIIELASTQEICNNPLHPYTQELLTAAIKYEVFSNRGFIIDEKARLVEQEKGHFVLT